MGDFFSFVQALWTELTCNCAGGRYKIPHRISPRPRHQGYNLKRPKIEIQLISRLI